MIFSQLKPIIYSAVTLVIGDEIIKYVEVRNSTKYDHFEVVGIRVDPDEKDCLLISLREQPVIGNPYHPEFQRLSSSHNSAVQAKD